MAAVFQPNNLATAGANYAYPGAGKIQTGDRSRSWDAVFTMAAASSQGNASRYNTDSDFAAQIWNPSEYGATSREGLAAAGTVGSSGLEAYGQAKYGELLAEAQKQQGAGSAIGGIVGGIGSIAASFIPMPKAKA